MCNNKERNFLTAEEIQTNGEARRDEDIVKARRWINKQPLRKSGYNKSLNYHYFNFKDFIGYVQEACERFDLSTHFTVENIISEPALRPATMRNEANNMPTYTAIGLLEIKSKHYHQPRQVRVPLQYQLLHQDIGKAVTYCKRQAYMLAFEIEEIDLVDMELTGEGDDSYHKKGNPVGYTNGKKLNNHEKAEPVNQTTLNTPSRNKGRDIIDLARTITEEMADKGIETTDKNIYAYTKQKWLDKKISPNEFRQLKARLQAGEK